MRKEISSCVLSSFKEPIAMLKKLTNCWYERSAAPSPIFDGAKTAAQRIWETMPNFSSAGKDFVKS